MSKNKFYSKFSDFRELNLHFIVSLEISFEESDIYLRLRQYENLHKSITLKMEIHHRLLQFYRDFDFICTFDMNFLCLIE